MICTGTTNYFRNKWKEHFDEEPDIERLNRFIMEDAVKIQPYITYFDKRKNELQTVLATYWIPFKAIVLKVDLESKSIVTFYTPEDTK